MKIQQLANIEQKIILADLSGKIYTRFDDTPKGDTDAQAALNELLDDDDNLGAALWYPEPR